MRTRRDFYLQGKSCIDCGGTKNLQFDHIDPETKLFEVGSGWGRTIESIEAEIAKCEVRCFDCHMKRHGFEETGHGHPWTYYGKGCRCELCKSAVNTTDNGFGKKKKIAKHLIVCGTRAMYNRGCRCDLCKEANNAYARERKARAYEKFRNAQ